MRSLSRLLLPLLVLLAVADHWRRVDGVVDGEHSWRQAHVVANVDMMLQHGVFTVPSTWNDDLAPAMYDFPVYQILVAALTRWSGHTPAMVAETLSVALFAITAVLTVALARLLGLSRAATAWALVFLALSPLARYWFAAALPDDLAMCCAVASACGWAWSLRAHGTASTWALAVWYVAAFVATLIKPPVYFPVVCTVVAITWWRQRWRGVRSPRFVAFLLVAAAAVVALRFATGRCGSDTAWSGSGGEWEWYFGSTAERTAWSVNATVLARIGKQAVTIVGFGAAAYLWLVRSGPWSDAALVLRVWCAAAVGSSLLFLHVNVVHSYYQLPCTVPLALAAGGGAALLCERVGAWSGRVAPAAIAGAALLAGTALTSERYLARMLGASTREISEAGVFLQTHTAADDFVVYVVANPDRNPAFLYFAQRYGRNAPPDAITYDTVPAPPATGACRRTVVYATKASAAGLISDPRWRQLAAHEHGVLLAARER